MHRCSSEHGVFIQFGLLQIAANKALRDDEAYIGKWWGYVDPPVYSKEVKAWLADHPDVKHHDFGFTCPMFQFPTDELADQFVEKFDPHNIDGFSHPNATSVGRKLTIKGLKK